MSASGKTSPVSIVDKNGKRTTVHRRVTGSSVPDSSLLLPPSLQSGKNSRRVKEEAIMAAAIQANIEHGYQLVDEASLGEAIGESNDMEVDLIAGAVHLDGFKEMLVNATSAPDDMASIAAVYDPNIALEGSINMRITTYCIAINAAHVYMRGPIEPLWQLADEKEETREKAKRYVAIYCAVSKGSMYKPTNDIADLSLNASDSDYEKILSALRNDQKATLEQLHFILEGGPSAISAGAL